MAGGIDAQAIGLAGQRLPTCAALARCVIRIVAP